MGFLDGLLQVLNGVKDVYAVSQAYPSLQDAINIFLADEFTVTGFTPFSATIWKQGFFGEKALSLTVLEDGSVLVRDTKTGSTNILPRRMGAPTPRQFELQMQAQANAKAQAQQACGPEAVSGRPDPKSEQARKTDLDMATAYSILGTSASASDTEVKSAYRARMSEYHPDKVASLPIDFRELAHEKTIRIQESYRLIMSARTGRDH